MICLACAVAVCTVYALILPAITLENDSCAIPEHTHTLDCYTQVTSVTKNVPVCSAESLNIHHHSQDCYDGSGNLICGYADFVVHTHDASCYDESGNLWCPLPEIKPHTHDALCYAVEEPHSHTEECYTLERGELVCGLEESDEHLHTDDCYDWNEVLTCGLPDGTQTQENAQPELICGKEEIILHTHTPDCYDADGNLICGRIEILEHRHTDTCFETVEVPLDTDALTCTLPEDESHTHGPLCYGTWELTCGLEAHTHSESCQSALAEEEQTEEATEPAAETEPIAETTAPVADATVPEETENVEESVPDLLSDQEQQAVYDAFLAEVEALEATPNADAWAQVLLQRLRDAYQQGLMDERYVELYERVYSLLYGSVDSVAEAAQGSNWILLRDSGWFEAFSESGKSAESAGFRMASPGAQQAVMAALDLDEDADTKVPPSDVQVVDRGGSTVSEDGAVSVSKTISGTELENVFDITLRVQTPLNVQEICEAPDMAVVIVMDISNTMNADFSDTTRYAAAMEAAESFLDQFADNNSLGISQVGYVAFNTDAHQIFGLTACSSREQANSLKNQMRTATGSIINANGYQSSHSRFTNVEAGLAMAADMLSGVSNRNKYIIFLSDGFPTTYISSGYSGYDPYDSTGQFYDHVLKKPCLYGTSYSDEAAIRARKKAETIKDSGVTIFSIGVDVGGQTIQKYVTQSETASDYSVVDRTGTTYEIGDASSTEAYKKWLKESIGSGFYYDSTDAEGLTNAYNQIFETIRHQIAEGYRADWAAEDPIPSAEGTAVEFIGFYDQSAGLTLQDLSGAHTPGGENTAQFNSSGNAIKWDLKASGYQASTDGSTTIYTYQLVYRVRLKNEEAGFTESAPYPTNQTTTLQYRVVKSTDGSNSISEPININFPIPSVKGYLSELAFQKVRPDGLAVPGAEFTLAHDTANCAICRGDGQSSVAIPAMTAVSDAQGQVSFSGIPSGHRYTLTETRVPDGYAANGDTYQVEVAYDQITVTVSTPDGSEKDWTGMIQNNTYYELPNTGGPGISLFTTGGLLLAAGTAFLLLYTKRGKKKF